MADQPARQARPTGRSVRLDTLVRLRWLALIGQTTAVLVVYVGLDYELPVWACLAVIALAAWLNIALRIRFPAARVIPVHSDCVIRHGRDRTRLLGEARPCFIAACCCHVPSRG